MTQLWVAIQWQDIVGVEQPWITPDEAKELKPAKMTTVGMVIKEAQHYLVIASTLEDANEPLYGNVNCIPRGCIDHIQVLGAGEAEGTTVAPG